MLTLKSWVMRNGAITQQLKRLPKHEDQSSDPQKPK